MALGEIYVHYLFPNSPSISDMHEILVTQEQGAQTERCWHFFSLSATWEPVAGDVTTARHAAKS